MARWILIVTLLPLLAIGDWGDDDADWGDDDWGDASTPFDAPSADGADIDPWEPFNRRVFAFNEQVDRYAARPVAKTYQQVTPRWFRRNVGNFFSNLNDLRGGLHKLLQLNIRESGSNFGRFAVNSTLGVGGLFDVASNVKIERHPSDLSFTLLHWGVPDGPYVMLPFLGPSTVLDTASIYPDRFTTPLHYLPNDYVNYGLTGLYVVDIRASFLGLEDAIIGDRYTFLRDTYLQRRMMQQGIERDAGEEFDALDAEFGDYDDDDW